MKLKEEWKKILYTHTHTHTSEHLDYCHRAHCKLFRFVDCSFFCVWVLFTVIIFAYGFMQNYRLFLCSVFFSFPGSVFPFMYSVHPCAERTDDYCCVENASATATKHLFSPLADGREHCTVSRLDGTTYILFGSSLSRSIQTAHVWIVYVCVCSAGIIYIF